VPWKAIALALLGLSALGLAALLVELVRAGLVLLAAL